MAASAALPAGAQHGDARLGRQVVDRAHHAVGGVAGDERCGCRHRFASLRFAAVDPTETFAELMTRRAVPLDEAAFAIAAHAWPDLDIGAELARLEQIAERVTEPNRSALSRVLFGDLGLRGNTDGYYEADNSFLNRVLDTGLGIPISLAVVMIEVGRRAGVALVGVNAPGHFLVRDAIDGALLDPFAGGAVTHAEDAPDCGTVTIVARMLNNLRTIYTTNGEHHHLIWVLRLRTLLPDASPELTYELTRAQARLN